MELKPGERLPNLPSPNFPPQLRDQIQEMVDLYTRRGIFKKYDSSFGCQLKAVKKDRIDPLTGKNELRLVQKNSLMGLKTYKTQKYTRISNFGF